MMPTAVDKLVESFPHPVVTPIIWMSTYDTLVDSIYHISYNTVSMQTMLGGGKIRFLVLTFLLMVYATLSSIPFVKPANPSLTPVIPKNKNGIKKTAIRYRFTLETELYTLLHNIDKALKHNLL